MVTLRRDVKTESERYGGYNTGFSATMTNYDRFRLSSEDKVETQEYDAKYYDTSEEYKDYLWNELQRTSPRRILSPEEVKSGVKAEDVIDYVEESTYTPARKVANSVQQKSKPISRDEERAQGLTTKAKILLVAYAVVVVFFLTLIAINANTLNVLNGKIASIESARAELTVEEAVTDTKSELVFGTGNENSLVNATPADDYALMSVSAPVSYELDGNWFDKVCDWLSNVVGG